MLTKKLKLKVLEINVTTFSVLLLIVTPMFINNLYFALKPSKNIVPTCMNKITRYSIFFIFFHLGNMLLAQVKSVDFMVQPYFELQPLYLNQSYNFDSNTVEFETLKFYASKLQLWKNEKLVWEEPDSYRLIDLEDSLSMHWELDVPNDLIFNQLVFQLGIDSLTHEKGIMGGDLDPIKGMYWAWNTGYINFKIEGISSLSSARDKSFQYHLGGYMQPFETVQTIRLDIPFEKKVLKMDISKFLSKVDLATEPRAMSPGAKAKELSKVVSTIFYFDEQK